jgi:hypothetical protein
MTAPLLAIPLAVCHAEALGRKRLTITMSPHFQLNLQQIFADEIARCCKNLNLIPHGCDVMIFLIGCIESTTSSNNRKKAKRNICILKIHLVV